MCFVISTGSLKNSVCEVNGVCQAGGVDMDVPAEIWIHEENSIGKVPSWGDTSRISWVSIRDSLALLQVVCTCDYLLAEEGHHDERFVGVVFLKSRFQTSWKSVPKKQEWVHDARIVVVVLASLNYQDRQIWVGIAEPRRDDASRSCTLSTVRSCIYCLPSWTYNCRSYRLQ